MLQREMGSSITIYNLLLRVKMEHTGLRVLPLHKFPQYLKPCCEMINQEWPRSETARMMSLQASCDNLPTSLILIKDEKHILGHCKLSPIPSITNSCFLEAVVINKGMRGKKLGTYLMQQVEKYCKNVLRKEMIHLSTKGQEKFYAKLGYTICAPISIYGSNSSVHKSPIATNKNLTKISNRDNNTADDVFSPPPPPPLPVPQNVHNAIKSTKTFMLKYLS